MKNCARRQGLRRRQVRACRWLESEDTGAAVLRFMDGEVEKH